MPWEPLASRVSAAGMSSASGPSASRSIGKVSLGAVLSPASVAQAAVLLFATQGAVLERAASDCAMIQHWRDGEPDWLLRVLRSIEPCARTATRAEPAAEVRLFELERVVDRLRGEPVPGELDDLWLPGAERRSHLCRLRLGEVPLRCLLSTASSGSSSMLLSTNPAASSASRWTRSVFRPIRSRRATSRASMPIR